MFFAGILRIAVDTCRYYVAPNVSVMEENAAHGHSCYFKKLLLQGAQTGGTSIFGGREAPLISGSKIDGATPKM